MQFAAAMRASGLFLVFVVTACSPPCEVEQLAECDDCGPGVVRRGVSAPLPVVDDGVGRASLAIRSLSCHLCDSVHSFDGAGNMLSATSVGPVQNVAVAPGGDIYVGDIEDEDSSDFRHLVIRALEPDGSVRWSVPYAPFVGFADGLIAAAEGVYVITGRGTSVDLLSRDRGEPLSGGRASSVLPDDHGGKYILIDENHLTGGPASITHVDATGTRRWERQLKAELGAGSMYTPISLLSAHPTADGVVIVGGFGGSKLIVGDDEVTPARGQWGAGFVLALGTMGEVTWLHAVDTIIGPPNAVTVVDGEIVVAGTYRGGGGALALPRTGEEADAYVAVYDATGPVRVHHLHGAGDQQVQALHAGDDGTVWATIDVHATDEDAELVTGSRAFGGGGPARRYFVQLDP